MNKRGLIGLIALILVVIVVLIIGGYFVLFSENWSYESCFEECEHRGFSEGICELQSEVQEDYENIGSCLIEDSEDCGNEGQCDCYCFNEQLVGGCAGVHMDYWDDCCENWALENNIIKIQCVGNWTVENDVCKWECEISEEQKRKPYCLINQVNGEPENIGWYRDTPKYEGSNLYVPHLIREEDCSGCEAKCKNIGTDSEGWYNSCNNELIFKISCV